MFLMVVRTHSLLSLHLYSPLSLWELARDVKLGLFLSFRVFEGSVTVLDPHECSPQSPGMVDLLPFLAHAIIWLILFLKKWNLGTEGHEEHKPKTFANRQPCQCVPEFRCFSKSNYSSILWMKWPLALRCANPHKWVPQQWVPGTLQTQKFLLCRRWTVGAVGRMLTWHWVIRGSSFCISRLCFPWKPRGVGAVLPQCLWDKDVHSSMDSSQQLSLAGKFNRIRAIEQRK